MGAEASKHADLVRSLERQVQHLATSTDGSLPELRRNIWRWPARRASLRTAVDGFSSDDDGGGVAAGFKTLSDNDSDSDNESMRAARGFPRGAGGVGSRHRTQSNWRWLGTDLQSGDEVFVELVIADVDADFCGHCRRSFGTAAAVPGGGVRIVHDPIQKVVADALRSAGRSGGGGGDDGADTHTFVVFGTYGSFPRSVQSPDVLVAGLAKNCIAPTFPKSWRDFARQCGGGDGGDGDSDGGALSSDEDDDDDGDGVGSGRSGGLGDAEPEWMARMGQSWVAAPEIPERLTLVAVAAYPRDQRPSEAAAAARRFARALTLLWGAEGAGLGVVTPAARGPQASGAASAASLAGVARGEGGSGLAPWHDGGVAYDDAGAGEHRGRRDPGSRGFAANGGAADDMWGGRGNPTEGYPAVSSFAPGPGGGGDGSGRQKKHAPQRHHAGKAGHHSDHSRGRGGSGKRYIRVVSHAMGSFVGHNEVHVFAEGMADGFARFLRSMGAGDPGFGSCVGGASVGAVAAAAPPGSGAELARSYGERDGRW